MNETAFYHYIGGAHGTMVSNEFSSQGNLVATSRPYISIISKMRERRYSQSIYFDNGGA